MDIEHRRARRPFIAAVSLATALAACTTTPLPPGGTAANPAISVDTLKEATRTLASDAFEGRAPGTPGEDKTVAYITEQFRKAGLAPGNNGSWVQDVPLVEITGTGFGPLTIGGEGRQAMRLEYGKDWVGSSYREVPQVALADSELVFVGYGIVAPEKGWNDYAGVDMRGKTAVILINDPDYAASGLAGEFGGRAMTYYGRWTYKFEEAARQGVAAAIIVHDTFPAAYGWNVVENSWSGPQVHAARADKGANQTMVNAWVQKPVADRIMASAGQDLATMSAAAGRKGFRPLPLGVAASTRFGNTIRAFTSRNVVGVLRGTAKPDETVLYTAHWDHLGRCPADASGDDICNGAIDNASGVAALVALAEANAKAGAAGRSQAFIALTSEEAGLLGSEYYAANPVFPLSRTVGGINIDGLPLAGRLRDSVAIGGAKSELDAYYRRAIAAAGLTDNPEPTPEKGYYYRSDHFNLAKVGVPMLYLKGGDDLAAGGKAAGAQWASDWTSQRYHQPSDEFDPNWDWGGAAQIVDVYFRIGRELATGSAWPNWNAGDEFRAARDRSCAADRGGC